MKNPFENMQILNFSQYLKDEFKDKKTGDVFYIDVDKYGKSIPVIRVTLNYIFDKKIVTRTDKEDKNILWVKVL